MSREDFEGVRQLAKENHDARVAKTPQRLKYATEQLERNGISYKICNDTTGQINCYFLNGTVLTFYAGTGKIKGCENKRGIKSFIRMCTKERDK